MGPGHFIGALHVDGNSGFDKIYKIADSHLMHAPRVAGVACWSHVRRGYFDEWASHKSPIAKDALDQFGAVFDIERPIKCQAPASVMPCVSERRSRRSTNSLDAQLQKFSGKSDLSGAIRYVDSP